MKKNLKLLVSSALVALTFSVTQAIHAMDTLSTKSDQSGIVHTAKLTSKSLDDFLITNPSLYHQVSTERYRASVYALRQEVIELQESISSFGTNGETSLIQKEIENLKQTISLQQEAFSKYGKDQGTAKEKITKEIAGLEKSKEEHQQSIQTSPTLKGLYEAQISSANASLVTCQKYLASLEKSDSTLKSTLEATETYLEQLGARASSADDLRRQVTKKFERLSGMYEEHVKGIIGPDIFPHHLPKIVLECLGVSSPQLSNVHTERLFHLFARTMELPYAYVQTGQEKEKTYLHHLNEINQNLTNRLIEDMIGLQMSAAIAKNSEIKFDLQQHNTKVEKLLINVKYVETINRDKDLETLKGILLSYGYKQEVPSQLLEGILAQSPHGLLGLYISALEFSPVTSWNHAEKISIHGRINNVKSMQEFSNIVVENVYTILGRHINKQVFEKIAEKLNENPQKPSTNQQMDWYV